MARRTLKPFIAGNWKMNGGLRSGAEVRRLARLLERQARVQSEVVICPPATLLHSFRPLVRGTPIALGGQDCHPEAGGAHTGDLSAAMLKDAGAKWVIVGHSERRRDHGETDTLVRAKAEAGLVQGLGVIVCIGETEAERDGGRTLAVVGRQLAGSLPGEVDAKRLVVAYEPVWAIGTGRTPSAAEIAEVHGFLRSELLRRGGEARLVYGGSVKPSNAAEILAIDEVDGALVGGASLKADDFMAIIEACGA